MYINCQGLLTSINLEKNYFGPEAAEALAPALRDSPSLTSVDLSSNKLVVHESGCDIYM